eukprot:scaffold39225_cov60-Phaeocystis_antarctica.AAC.1
MPGGASINKDEDSTRGRRLRAPSWRTARCPGLLGLADQAPLPRLPRLPRPPGAASPGAWLRHTLGTSRCTAQGPETDR